MNLGVQPFNARDVALIVLYVMYEDIVINDSITLKKYILYRN